MIYNDCKDCIHHKVCGKYVDEDDIRAMRFCLYFKDKSQIIELPCKVGDDIFYVRRNSQGNNTIFKANVLDGIVAISGNIKKIYLKIIYEDIEGYTDRATAIYGVNAFSNLEEAVARLKELRK